MTVKVRRTRSSGGGNKPPGELKWWKKLVHWKGKQKGVNTPPARKEAFTPNLSESEMYIYNRSNPLYEDSVASRASVMSMIKDWAKIHKQSAGLSPRKQNGGGLSRQFTTPGEHHKNKAPSTPKKGRRSPSPLPPGSPHRTKSKSPRGGDTSGAYAGANILLTPFSAKGQHLAQRCDMDNGGVAPFAWPQFSPPHEVFGGGGLIQSKSVPLALSDVFLAPESLREVGCDGGRRETQDLSGLSCRTAGCKEPKRRVKQGNCAGLTGSKSSHSKTQSSASSAIGCPSSYFGSSNPSESSAACSDDTEDAKKRVIGIPSPTAVASQQYRHLFDMPQYSDQIRTVRRVGGRNGDSVRFVDTVRSSCEDDLNTDPYDDKRPKSKRLLSKLTFKKEMDNTRVPSPMNSSKSGRQTPEARSPQAFSNWKKSSYPSDHSTISPSMSCESCFQRTSSTLSLVFIVCLSSCVHSGLQSMKHCMGRESCLKNIYCYYS